MSPDALIFDVDGTLAETEELHRAAFNAVFEREGLSWHWDAQLYGQLLKVTGGKERLRHFCDLNRIEAADSTIARLHAAKNSHYAALMRSGACPLRPGVADLIGRARAAGKRLAICTTTSRANVDVLLETSLGPGAAGWFGVIVAGDEVKAKKPAPDAYLKALELLDLPAALCLAFEDSGNGLKSALAAGIRTIVTPGLYTAGENFDGAAQVLVSLEGFAW